MYNPLDVLVNDLVELAFDDDSGMYDVEQIIAYVVDADGGPRQATRYFLQDVESEADQGDPLVLEIVEPPDPEAPQRQFLFAITEAFDYDEAFASLLDDDIFIISDHHDGQGEPSAEELEYRKVWAGDARITVTDERNAVNAGAMGIWKYQRQDDGDTWYLTIEIDRDDGWTTFYEGYELAEDEWQLSRLSGDL